MISVAVCVLGLAASGSASDTIESLIPVGRLEVEVLTLTAPAPYPDLVARFRKAVRARPSWWQEYVKHAGPGPLPWHENLGLSRADYAAFLELSGQLRFTAVRKATILVTKRSGSLLLDGGDELPDLWEVEVSPSQSTVKSPIGSCSGFTVVKPSPGQKATGPWRGFSCVEAGGAPETGDARMTEFDVGRLAESGMVFLSYRAKRMREGALERADVYVRYRLR